MSEALASLIARTDKVLAGLEDKAIAQMNLALVGVYKDLEKKLLASYPKYTTDAMPGLLANQRSLLLFDELKAVLGQTVPPAFQAQVEALYENTLGEATKEGLTLSDELMKLRGGGSFVTATAKIPIEVVAQAAKNAASLVVGKNEEFKKEARYLIVQGLATGAGGRKIAGQLRQRLGVTQGRAEAIARTEVNRAQSEAAKANYKANGLEYFQSIATADGRICPYCGDRNGNVYALDEGHIPWHIFCRCYAAPFSPHWEDEGLTSNQWMKDFHDEGVEILQKQGMKLNKGPTYFERKAGLTKAPSPVWTPGKGYLVDKAKLLGVNEAAEEAEKKKKAAEEAEAKKKAAEEAEAKKEAEAKQKAEEKARKAAEKKAAEAERKAKTSTDKSGSLPGTKKIDSKKIKELKLPAIKTQKDFDKYFRAHVADLNEIDNQDGLIDLSVLEARMTLHGLNAKQFRSKLLSAYDETFQLTNNSNKPAFSINGLERNTLSVVRAEKFKSDPIIEAWHKSQKGKVSGEIVDDFEGFKAAAGDYIDRMSPDNGNLTKIYEIRAHLGDRVTKREFNEWLIDLQAEDLIQLMGGDLPGVTPEQLTNSVKIPGAGTRFYVQKIKPDEPLNQLADRAAEKKTAEEAEAKRKAAEKKARKVAEEAESKRKAEAEKARKAAEKKAAEEAEAKRKAAEEKARKVAEEAEAKRKAEAEKARKAAEKKAAEEAEAKRKAEAEKARKAAEEKTAKAGKQGSLPGTKKVDPKKTKELKLPAIKTQKDFDKYFRAHVADLNEIDNQDGLIDLSVLEARMTLHGLDSKQFRSKLLSAYDETFQLTNNSNKPAFSINGLERNTLAVVRAEKFKSDPIIEAWHKSQKGKVSGEIVDDFEGFKAAAGDYIDRMSPENGNLTKIHEIRAHLGDRITKREFNEWLIDLQAEDLIQMMGGDLPDVTPEQLTNSVKIPGAGTRFYVAKLKPNRPLNPLSPEAVELVKPEGVEAFLALGRDRNKDFYKSLRAAESATATDKQYDDAFSAYNTVKKKLMADPGNEAHRKQFLAAKRKLQDLGNVSETKIAKAFADLRKRLINAGDEKEAKEWAALRLSIAPSAAAERSDAVLRTEMEEFHRLSRGKVEKTLTKLEKVKGRASANQGGRSIDIGHSRTEAEAKQTLFHEAGHHVEYSDKRFFSAVDEWMHGRATSTTPVRINTAEGFEHYADDEVYLPGKFLEPYIARQYFYSDLFGNKTRYEATEVVSMGLEYFDTAERMRLLHDKDKEMFDLMLGILESD